MCVGARATVNKPFIPSYSVKNIIQLSHFSALSSDRFVVISELISHKYYTSKEVKKFSVKFS